MVLDYLYHKVSRLLLVMIINQIVQIIKRNIHKKNKIGAGTENP